MSHQPERKEKTCLNCGASLHGRFCHICGQENIETKQGFWSLTRHFIFDVLHFDGKFFDTLKHLLFRPGVISKEYIAGKRTKYLDPVRMYLFTSFLFFFVFFSLQKPNINNGRSFFLNTTERNQIDSDLQVQLRAKPSDTILKKQIALFKDTSLRIHIDSTRDEIAPDKKILYKGKQYEITVIPNINLRQYSKINGNDGWFTKISKRKNAEFMAKYGDNLTEGLSNILESFLHRLSYLLFLSLPFFAGILKLLYIRNKRFYFSDHAIFTLHHYIISFILMMIAIIFSYLHNVTGFKGFQYGINVLFFAWIVYLYLEMKVFYAQGWAATFGKFILLNFMAIIVLSLLFAIFLLFSIFQI